MLQLILHPPSNQRNNFKLWHGTLNWFQNCLHLKPIPLYDLCKLTFFLYGSLVTVVILNACQRVGLLCCLVVRHSNTIIILQLPTCIATTRYLNLLPHICYSSVFKKRNTVFRLSHRSRSHRGQWCSYRFCPQGPPESTKMRVPSSCFK